MEFDFNVFSQEVLEDGCKSETDLPSGYDDCPTAGVSELDDYYAYGYGTRSAIAIRPGFPYSSRIFELKPKPGVGIGTVADYSFTASMMKRIPLCPAPNSPWCFAQRGDPAYLISQNRPDFMVGIPVQTFWETP